MNFNEAETEIREFFNSRWAGNTPIAFPDVSFTPPNNASYVKFFCEETVGTQATMGSPGSNRFRHFGVVGIQIYAPEWDGSITARQLAQDALNIFMGKKTANGIIFFDVRANQIGNDGDGSYQINIFAPFRYDQLF